MKTTFRDDAIVMLGDTHSTFRALGLLTRNEVWEGADVFHVGDFGLGFDSRAKDLKMLERMNEMCIKKDLELFVIRGNHDNPHWWNHPPEFSNIHLVPDYTTLVFPCGRRALAVGGGISVDRWHRMEGLGYWSDEITLWPPAVLGEHDYVFAHDAPNAFNNATMSLHKFFPEACKMDSDLIADCSVQRGVMDEIMKRTKCCRWISGHYHNSEDTKDKSLGVHYRCLDKKEVWEFKAT
jgi:DNA repair exonuclease SbcCD nuclease subunit